MTCDHSKCGTPFCPICGANLAGNAIVGLRAYVSNQLAQITRTIERLKARNYGVPDRHYRNQERWASWMKALDALIAEAKKS